MISGLALAALTARVRLRVTYNTLWRHAGARRRITTVVLLLLASGFLVIGIWLPEVVAGLALTTLSPATLRERLGLVFSLGFLVYSIVLLYGSFTFALSSMLTNRDLELLLTAPWPVSAVLASKVFVRAGFLLLLALLLLWPLILVTGLALGRPGLVPLAVLVLLAMPLLISVAVALLALLAVRLVPPNRGKEVLTILSLVFAGGINAANALLNPAYNLSGHIRHGGAGAGLTALARSPLVTSPLLPWSWAGHALADAAAGYWGSALGPAALLLAVTAVALVLGVEAMGGLYLSGWGQSTLAGARGRRRREAPRAPAAAQTATGHRRAPWLDPAAAALVRKDWRVRRRDLVLFVRALLPVFFLGIFFFRNSGGALELVRGLGGGPAGALAAVAPATVLLLAVSSELGLSAIGLEGGAIWVWTVSPNPIRRLLLAKCLAAAAPTIALATLLGVALEAIAQPGWGWSLGAIALLALTAGCLSVILVCLGAMAPRFDWTDPRRIVAPAIAWVALLFETILFLTVALLAGAPVLLSLLLGWPRLPAFLLGLLLGGGAACGLTAIAVPVALTRLAALEPGATPSEAAA